MGAVTTGSIFFGRRSHQKPSDFRTPLNSSPEQPNSDIISGVAMNPPSPVAPRGGLVSPPSAAARQATSGRIKSASRSSMSRRTTRGPQTWKPYTR
jgi:hypothetical protein